jgi:hypothetical protein
MEKMRSESTKNDHTPTYNMLMSAKEFLEANAKISMNDLIHVLEKKYGKKYLHRLNIDQLEQMRMLISTKEILKSSSKCTKEDLIDSLQKKYDSKNWHMKNKKLLDKMYKNRKNKKSLQKIIDSDLGIDIGDDDDDENENRPSRFQCSLMSYMESLLDRCDRWTKELPLHQRGVLARSILPRIDACRKVGAERKTHEWLFQEGDIVECWPWKVEWKKEKELFILKEHHNISSRRWLRGRIVKIYHGHEFLPEFRSRKERNKGKFVQPEFPELENEGFKQKCANFLNTLRKHGLMYMVEMDSIHAGMRNIFIPLMHHAVRDGHHQYIRAVLHGGILKNCDLDEYAEAMGDSYDRTNCERDFDMEHHEFTQHILRDSTKSNQLNWRIFLPQYDALIGRNKSSLGNPHLRFSYKDVNVKSKSLQPRFVPDLNSNMWFSIKMTRFAGGEDKEDRNMTRAVDPSCWNEAFDLEDCTKLAQIAQWCARKIDECSKHFKIRAEEVKYFDVNRRWFCGHLMYHDVEAHHSRSSETDNLRDRRFDPLPLKLYLSKFAGVAGSKCPGIQSSLDMARLTSNAPTKVPFLIGCRFDVLRRTVDCYMKFDSWILDKANSKKIEKMKKKSDTGDKALEMTKKSIEKMRSKFVAKQEYVEIFPCRAKPEVGASYRSKLHIAASHRDDTVVRVVQCDAKRRVVEVEEFTQNAKGGYWERALESETNFGTSRNGGSRKMLRWVNLGPRVWLSPFRNNTTRFELYGENPIVAKALKQYKKSSGKRSWF